MIPTISNPFEFSKETVAGLDISLRCPALCVIPATTKPSFLIPFQDCQIHYLTDKKAYANSRGNMHGEILGAWQSDAERYESIAEWVVRVLKKYDVKHCGIEDYAFSKNHQSSFQLAENMGLLKYYLHKAGISYDKYPPTTIKKVLTGSGNARKEQMRDSFIVDTGFDIMGAFGKKPLEKPVSPINDIIDAYTISLCARIANAVQARDFAIEAEKPLAKRRRRK